MTQTSDTENNQFLHIMEYICNENVKNEIENIEKSKEQYYEKIIAATTLNDYLSDFLNSTAGIEFLNKVGVSPSLKILDIGFGRGETSLYLASQGCSVISIDPSPANCELLFSASKKFKLPINIYQGIAEELANVKENDFDICMFNSSFHHCFDPMKVLNCLRNKIKKTGCVIAINEPILKFYRSKKHFYNLLEENPVKSRNYGGNEHIYYSHEYIKMLQAAGFRSVNSMINTQYRNPRKILLEDLNKKIDGQYILSNTNILIKFIALLFIEKIHYKPVIQLIKKLSLLNFSFKASL
jgi:2-polyprenyl-3-methyl-5-hydroxy-6-metoxy-1,4-benzoquinol methylase